MKLLKQIAWYAISAVCLTGLFPIFWVMGEMEQWREICAKAREM